MYEKSVVDRLRFLS